MKEFSYDFNFSSSALLAAHNIVKG